MLFEQRPGGDYRCLMSKRPDRVVVFVDWQNVFSRARALFHGQRRHVRAVDGQIDPVELADLICRRGSSISPRELADVRVYCGVADQHEDPKMFQARANQVAAWERQGVTAITRRLQYLTDPRTRRRVAREKGIDVALAVDVVKMAIREEYDVGVVFSADTDLRPALEFVAQEYPSLRVEVAAWQHGRDRRRLNFESPAPTWCHYLNHRDYMTIRDPEDYRPRR